MNSLLDLLKSKGYKGLYNYTNIVKWLSTKGIYISFNVELDGPNLVGYYCQVYLPPYNSYFRSNIFKSYSDALENCLYKLNGYF